MKRSATLCPLILVAAVAGCANWTVRSEVSSTAPLAAYRTYEWATPASALEIDRLVDQRVRDRVAFDLAKKGIHPAAPGTTPDFYVEYSVGSGPRVQQVQYDFGLGTEVGGSGQTVIAPAPSLMPYVYAEAALVLDFIDARTGRVFWRGYASYVVDRPPEVATSKTSEAAARILRQYPVRFAGAARPSG
jgi:hypothetical protein